jgi:hypothetical protein
MTPFSSQLTKAADKKLAGRLHVPASTIAPLIAAEFDAGESAPRLLKAPFSAILAGIRV